MTLPVLAWTNYRRIQQQAYRDLVNSSISHFEISVTEWVHSILWYWPHRCTIQRPTQTGFSGQKHHGSRRVNGCFNFEITAFSFMATITNQSISIISMTNTIYYNYTSSYTDVGTGGHTPPPPPALITTYTYFIHAVLYSLLFSDPASYFTDLELWNKLHVYQSGHT